MPDTPAIIDSLDRDPPEATCGTRWQVITDAVMGGVSEAGLDRGTVDGRLALRLRGAVRLENNGGFVQMALDLSPDGGDVDASAWTGLEVDVFGNDQDYGLHLRTSDLTRPWQSYRHTFAAPPEWRSVRLPFAALTPHRTDAPLDLRHLRRLGLVAIGHAFAADLAMGGLRFYR